MSRPISPEAGDHYVSDGPPRGRCSECRKPGLELVVHGLCQDCAHSCGVCAGCGEGDVAPYDMHTAEGGSLCTACARDRSRRHGSRLNLPPNKCAECGDVIEDEWDLCTRCSERLDDPEWRCPSPTAVVGGHE